MCCVVTLIVQLTVLFTFLCVQRKASVVSAHVPRMISRARLFIQRDYRNIKDCPSWVCKMCFMLHEEHCSNTLLLYIVDKLH